MQRLANLCDREPKFPGDRSLDDPVSAPPVNHFVYVAGGALRLTGNRRLRSVAEPHLDFWYG